MKHKLFMYLFFFAVLFILFQYMNEKSIFESQEKKINSLTQKKLALDSLRLQAENKLVEANFFNLMGNDDAMTYLENLGMEAEDAKALVSDAIFEKNFLAGGNPLVPVEGGTGEMRINKVKFLNHRWVIANFSDGSYWGEVLIDYFFDENNKLYLKSIDAIIYPN